jgi:hypothetical protein
MQLVLTFEDCVCAVNGVQLTFAILADYNNDPIKPQVYKERFLALWQQVPSNFRACIGLALPGTHSLRCVGVVVHLCAVLGGQHHHGLRARRRDQEPGQDHSARGRKSLLCPSQYFRSDLIIDGCAQAGNGVVVASGTDYVRKTRELAFFPCSG